MPNMAANSSLAFMVTLLSPFRITSVHYVYAYFKLLPGTAATCAVPLDFLISCVLTHILAE